MAKWIAEARQDEEESDSDEDAPQPQICAYSKMTLQTLFGEQTKRSNRMPREVVNREAELMEALANAEEDEIPDDGAIEVDSEEEYRP